MSHIVIVESWEMLAALPADNLTTTLNGWIDTGRFTRRYAGPARRAIEETVT